MGLKIVVEVRVDRHKASILAKLPEELRVIIYCFLGATTKLQELNVSGAIISKVRNVFKYGPDGTTTVSEAQPILESTLPTSQITSLLALMRTNRFFHNEIRSLVYGQSVLVVEVRYFSKYNGEPYRYFEKVSKRDYKPPPPGPPFTHFNTIILKGDGDTCTFLKTLPAITEIVAEGARCSRLVMVYATRPSRVLRWDRGIAHIADLLSRIQNLQILELCEAGQMKGRIEIRQPMHRGQLAGELKTIVYA